MTTKSNAKAKANTVSITSGGYSPSTIEIDLVETVEWTNDDAAPHTVSFDTGDRHDLAPGGTAAQKFTTPGTWNYHCEHHPEMKGVVVVK
jgi:plastocyanin